MQKNNKNVLNKKIDLTGISWVRLSFVDVFGSSHSIQLPAERFEASVKHGESFDGSTLQGRSRIAETDMLLKPDPNTLISLNDTLARAVCTVMTSDGKPWPGDPRIMLLTVIEQTRDLGQDYTVSAELEFYFLDSCGTPIDKGGYFAETEGLGMSLARQSANRLAQLGVDVHSVHHEAGPGQYEIDLAPLAPLQLADALVLAKHVIRKIAIESNLTATFMPRPLANEPGSGLHLHQRVGSRLIDDNGNLKEEGRFFLAGQLAHARGLSALAAPTVNSYKRLHSGSEAPNVADWAHVNRGALLRLNSSMPDGATIEFRGADPSANPYLLFAGLIIAGADGIEANLELPLASEEEVGTFDPAATSDSARFESLPRDLDDALDALLADDVLIDVFDHQLISQLVDGRRAETAAYHDHVTSWEIDRYLDEA